MRQLSIADVARLISSISELDGLVLVGGQALNFWAEQLGIATPNSSGSFGPALSADIDFLGTAAEAQAFAEAIKGKILIAGLEDHSPNVALVTFDLDGETHEIDFLRHLKGFTPRELDEVWDKASVVELEDATPKLRIMHPMHCLLSQLENVYGMPLNRRDEPNGERYAGRVRLAIETCRCLSVKHLDEGNTDGALEIAEAVHAMSRGEPAMRARHTDSIVVEDGTICGPPMPSNFLERRLPQLQRLHGIAVKKYEALLVRREQIQARKAASSPVGSR